MAKLLKARSALLRLALLHGGTMPVTGPSAPQGTNDSSIRVARALQWQGLANVRFIRGAYVLEVTALGVEAIRVEDGRATDEPRAEVAAHLRTQLRAEYPLGNDWIETQRIPIRSEVEA